MRGQAVGVTDVFIGLGSNCTSAQELLFSACARIAAIPGIHERARSPIYWTEPQGVRDQPWFLNCVVHVEADESVRPIPLLRTFLALEQALGRKRGPFEQRFGPRPIDIDLLLFGDEVSDTPACILPHPRMHKRAFVLVPLIDLAPDLLLYGQPLASHLAKLCWRREGERIYQTEDVESPII
ncbi:MAG: 2-amino-4-hydroxy-6-hydroxymethyldihydropteridine diphosphokinase [Desulfovibrionaceae bacterium]|nr:2-amino-4-hydroxy-6-hydroxymethyldihydropteridine diphosphokinase [Desulfovibrionaceae bacterium]